MFELSYDQIVVELWPSLTEIRTSKCNNVYTRCLTEFYDSLDTLLKSLHSSKVPVDVYTDIGHEKGKPVMRDFPPAIVELAAWLSSTGITIALYKALKLWVDYKNGRRIKIVDGNIEVEATQLTRKQFLQLFETIRESRETLANRGELKEKLMEKGIKAGSVESIKRLKESSVLNNAARSRSNKHEA